MVCKPTIIQNGSTRRGEGSASVPRLETIPHPRFGEDVLWRTGIGLQLLAQLADEDPQIFVLFDAVTAPHRVQNRAVSQHLAGMLRMYTSTSNSLGVSRTSLPATTMECASRSTWKSPRSILVCCSVVLGGERRSAARILASS